MQYELYKDMRFVMFGTREEIKEYSGMDDSKFDTLLETKGKKRERGWNVKEKQYESYILDEPHDDIFNATDKSAFREEWNSICEKVAEGLRRRKESA